MRSSVETPSVYSDSYRKPYPRPAEARSREWQSSHTVELGCVHVRAHRSMLALGTGYANRAVSQKVVLADRRSFTTFLVRASLQSFKECESLPRTIVRTGVHLPRLLAILALQRGESHEANMRWLRKHNRTFTVGTHDRGSCQARTISQM